MSLISSKMLFIQVVMLFNAESRLKIQSKVSNLILEELVFSELQEVWVLDLMEWDIKELRFHHTTTHFLPRSLADREHSRVLPKNFTELSMNLELEESRLMLSLLRTFYLIQISMLDKLILHLLIQLQNFLNLMRVQSQESKDF